MPRQRLNRWAHGLLRRRAHAEVAAMDLAELRNAIHCASPLPGRLFTLVAGEQALRGTIHAALASMSRQDLRTLAGGRLPAPLRRLLEWLDR